MLARPLRSALRAILRQPVRNTLLVFTFALGFAMVLMVIGTIEGGRKEIRESLHALGIDVIGVLNPIQIEGIPFLKLGRGGDRPVDREAVDELADELGDRVRSITPLRLELTFTRRGPDYYTNTLVATAPSYTEAIRSGLVAGRFLESTDVFVEGGVNNVVFDEALARFFEPEAPEKVIGQLFEAKRHKIDFTAKVVGVLRDPIVLRRHMGVFDTQRKARSLTARRLEFLNTYVLYDAAVDDPSGVLLQAESVAEVESMRDQLVEFFDARGIEPYYHVQKEWVVNVLEVVDRFSFLLHFLWVVALGVVLILTATITTLAIEERYLEIAIQRVEGARVADAVLDILVEGGFIALISAPIGFAISHYVFRAVIADYLWAPSIPAIAVWGTPLLLIFTAIAAYGIPARRIARLEPAYVLGEYLE